MHKPIVELRYGENAHQKRAWVNRERVSDDLFGVGNLFQIEGENPSFTNVTDIDRALTALRHCEVTLARRFGTLGRKIHVAIAVKHGNPCGAAFGGVAISKMLRGDLEAIMGGCVITNFRIEENSAIDLIGLHVKGQGKRILDVVVAPDISPGAVSLLARKGGKCKMFVNKHLHEPLTLSMDAHERPLCGGMSIKQDPFTFVLDFDDPSIQVHGYRSPECEHNLAFASALCAT